MRILILGASGLLGHSLLCELAASGDYALQGTVRAKAALAGLLPDHILALLQEGVEAYDFPSIVDAVRAFKPDVLINCIGLIRQRPEGRQPLRCIELNARLPHLLLALCRERNIRLIHYSTDCVFDGGKGAPYLEDDPPSAKDVYGLSKYLGELREPPALTIRTSIIGHELRNKLSLLEWFLGSAGKVKGYTRAIYSGLPVTEQARILKEYILPAPELCGLVQVAGRPISKYDLLRLIKEIYGQKTVIEPEPGPCGNKILSGEKFFMLTGKGYLPPDWPELISAMHETFRHKHPEALT